MQRTASEIEVPDSTCRFLHDAVVPVTEVDLVEQVLGAELLHTPESVGAGIPVAA